MPLFAMIDFRYLPLRFFFLLTPPFRFAGYAFMLITPLRCLRLPLMLVFATPPHAAPPPLILIY